MKNPNFETPEMQAFYASALLFDQSPEVLRLEAELNAEARRDFWRVWVPVGAVFATIAAAATYWLWGAYRVEGAVGIAAFVVALVATRYPRAR